MNFYWEFFVQFISMTRCATRTMKILFAIFNAAEMVSLHILLIFCFLVTQEIGVGSQNLLKIDASRNEQLIQRTDRK